MYTVDDFIRVEIEEKVLLLLKEIEETYQEIVEEWSSKLGISKPRVLVTMQNVDECRCPEVCESDDTCRLVTGEYYPESATILLNYRSTLDTLLHLYVHHVQCVQVGVEKFKQMRDVERMRLPWSLRPTEIRAVALSKRLYNTLCSQRVVKLWTDYVKSRIKILDETYSRVRGSVRTALLQSMPYAYTRDLVKRLAISRDDGTRTGKDTDRL